MSERSERMEIASTDLFDRLTAILARLATGKKHDPSWMRPMVLTYDERKSDYYEAEAIIEELRKRSNSLLDRSKSCRATADGKEQNDRTK